MVAAGDVQADAGRLGLIDVERNELELGSLSLAVEGHCLDQAADDDVGMRIVKVGRHDGRDAGQASVNRRRFISRPGRFRRSRKR